MLQCSSCHKRFTIDHGQLTHYSHQDESKWNLLITDTFAQVPAEKTAATLDISTYTVWRMRMKLLHMFEKLLNTTVVSGEIELDEKYLLNSHKGEKTAGVASKYLNRYTALFVLVREYSRCDVQEILLSIKKRMHQTTDFFRIVDMKSEDIFIY